MKKNILIVGLLLVAGLGWSFYNKHEKEKASSTFPVAVVSENAVKDDGKSDEKETGTFESGLKVSIDIVRVETDGSMVAAGKGVKGAAFSLMDGDSVLTEMTVNEDGEWVYIPSVPLVPGDHEIWLRDDSMNSREESEVVAVSVPEPKNAGEVLAVMISQDAEDVNVLQAPEPQVQADIDIRSINHTAKRLMIQGTAREDGKVNIYADNLYLGNATVKNGEWALRVSKRLEAGKKYMIRADKVDDRGKVFARVEVPFEMESGMENAKRRRVRIVKGDCLWTIAKQLYGTGFAYVTIYQANKKQIKDPNLIYPNQVFVLPTKAEK